jgi:predicted amidohydrolase
MSTLTITGLNLDIAWKNKEENFKKIENKLASAEADLFLLPEMFSTGFCMEAEEVADRNEESLTWMKSFAKIEILPLQEVFPSKTMENSITGSILFFLTAVLNTTTKDICFLILEKIKFTLPDRAKNY